MPIYSTNVPTLLLTPWNIGVRSAIAGPPIMINQIADSSGVGPPANEDDRSGTDAEWRALEQQTFTSAQFEKIAAHLKSTGKASA